MHPDELLENLTEPQRQAVSHTEGPLLVLAGPGSGKTRVITRRAAYIAATVARPWEVLAITFTNKAAGEMRERIGALGADGGMWVSTFHALCARLLREFGDLAGIDRRFSIFDQADSRAAIKQAIEACDLKASNWSPAAVQAVISDAKTRMLRPAEFAEQAYDFAGRTQARVYEAYDELLRRQNAVDFDDLLMLVARMLRENDEVRERLGERFRYLLIDEYQDTNHAQYLIATLLAQRHRNICATGDPDQSIYAWRGADIQNILDFEADYADAAVVRLEENFRSTGAILSAAAELISHNALRKPKDLFTSQDAGEAVRVWSCDDEKHEAATLTEDVRAYLEEGGQAGDIAVFYRVNALSRVVEDALRRAHIPYQIARGVEFYARKEIKDVLSYLRVIVNPADETALVRAINTPARGIGRVTVDRILAYAAHRRLTAFDALMAYESIDGLKSAKKKLAGFARLLAQLQEMPRRPVRDIVEAVAQRSGISDELAESGDIDNAPLDNVYELINAAGEYDAENPEGSLDEWLHQISLVSDTDALKGAGGAVTLMTLHAAKGLEFPVVYMVGLEEGLLPHRRVLDEGDAALEEERRLAFVGMTRAMRRLTLSHAKYRMVRGITERAMASRFLKELPAEEIDHKKLTIERDRSFAHLGRFNTERYESDDGMFFPGCRVRHDEYGVGQVIALESRLRSRYVRVFFPEHGTRSFALEHVSLYILDE